MELHLPQIGGGLGHLELDLQTTLYVLGPNGSGKSSLILRWAQKLNSPILISGNREVVFETAAVSISASEAQQQNNISQRRQQNAESKHKKGPHNDKSRLSRLLFSLKSTGEFYNEEYVKADQLGHIEKKSSLLERMPIKLMNQAFKAATLPLSMAWTRHSELTVEKVQAGASYGIDSMSDGERAALILSAEVILAEKGSAILIDEPERHLHRAISAPLLEYLRGVRSDLYWVVSTHDLSLPHNDPVANVLVLHDFDGNAWRSEELTDVSHLDPTVAQAIYGGRNKVLFVEGAGDDHSRDFSLYSILFNGVTIVPAGTCNDVVNAVAGLASIPSIHHMEPKGLVDADNREDVENLRSKGVFLIDVYAVESIYYHSRIIEAVHCFSPTAASLADVISAACKSFNAGSVDYLSKLTAYNKFVRAYRQQQPSYKVFCDGVSNFSVDFPDSLEVIREERERLEKLIEQSKWDDIVKFYKIKSSSAPVEIAKKLGLKDAKTYELAVRQTLQNTPSLRDRVSLIVPDPFG